MPLFGPPNIKKLKQKRAINGLIKALSHKNWAIQCAAAAALAELGDLRAVEPLLVMLHSKGSASWLEKQEAAARALGRIGDKRAVEPLVKVVLENYYYADSSSFYREIPPLDSKKLRQEAAQALKRIGDPRAVELLVTGLNDVHSEKRLAAAEALGQIGDKRAIEPLVAPLQKADIYLAAAAAKALGQIGDMRAVGPLVTAFQNNDYIVPSVARNIVEALVVLGQIKDTRVVEPIFVALRKKKLWSVRLAVAEILGEVGDTRAVELIVAAFQDETELLLLASELQASLRTQFPTGETQPEARETERALRAIKTHAMVETLLRQLKEAHPDVRLAAVQILEDVGDTTAVELLVAVLQETNERLATTAAQGQTLTMGDLSYHGQMRLAAVRALGQIGDARAIQTLLALLEDMRYSSGGPRYTIVAKALEQILRSATSSITSDDLRMVAHIEDGFRSQTVTTGRNPLDDSWDQVEISVGIDHSHLRRFAQQELARRGLEE